MRFVITSRLEPDKRHRDLLEALGRLKRSASGPFRLDIFGEGSLRGELQDLAEEQGLDEEVTFKGFSRGVADELARYDFGVLTSTYESLANTVLEYLAAGLPAVATNTGGIPEMLHDGKNGFAFDPGDVDKLTSLMGRCIEMERQEFAGLSRNAIHEIAAHFDRGRQAQKLHDYCVALVAGTDPTLLSDCG